MRIASRLSVPMVLPPSREPDHDVVAVDLERLHRADVHAGDAHLVAGVQSAGVGELRRSSAARRTASARW